MIVKVVHLLIYLTTLRFLLQLTTQYGVHEYFVILILVFVILFPCKFIINENGVKHIVMHDNLSCMHFTKLIFIHMSFQIESIEFT